VLDAGLPDDRRDPVGQVDDVAVALGLEAQLSGVDAQLGWCSVSSARSRSASSGAIV
jgi:hypothetical protein